MIRNKTKLGKLNALCRQEESKFTNFPEQKEMWWSKVADSKVYKTNRGDSCVASYCYTLCKQNSDQLPRQTGQYTRETRRAAWFMRAARPAHKIACFVDAKLDFVYNNDV